MTISEKCNDNGNSTYYAIFKFKGDKFYLNYDTERPTNYIKQTFLGDTEICGPYVLSDEYNCSTFHEYRDTADCE